MISSRMRRGTWWWSIPWVTLPNGRRIWEQKLGRESRVLTRRTFCRLQLGLDRPISKIYVRPFPV